MYIRVEITNCEDYCLLGRRVVYLATDVAEERTVFIFLAEFLCNINMDTVSFFEMVGTNTKLHEVTCERNRPLYSQLQRERQTSHEMRNVTGRILAFCFVQYHTNHRMRLLPQIVMLEYRNCNFTCSVGTYSLVCRSKGRRET
jgi:hypothetical protein